MALKRVYTRSRNYLVTIEALSSITAKKDEGDIDYFLIATEQKFSDAIKEIAKQEFHIATDLSPMMKGKLIDLNHTTMNNK